MRTAVRHHQRLGLFVRDGLGRSAWHELRARPRNAAVVQDVLLAPDVGDHRLSATCSLNVRVNKVLRRGGYAVNVDLAWFNMLKAGTVLGRQYDVATEEGPTGPAQTLEIMNPSLLRVGFRLEL